jgi:hypothetical protein
MTNRPLARSEAGYSLLEMLVSTAIMVTITGAIFTIVNPAQGTSRTQPEAADMQQRARIGADTLFKDLVMAGAGPYQGTTTGSLANFFAPIFPYRMGKVSPDPPGSYKDNTITIVYVPNTSAQTTIRDPMPNVSSEIKVNAQPNCPVGDELCGFKEGMSVLIFDPLTGAFDTFEITRVQTSALHLQHKGQNLSEAYPSGANIAQAQYHTYWHDTTQNQLRHYDGLDTDIPIVDNVVDLKFEYWGDPEPPRVPKPPTGVTNCVLDGSGNPRLATLTAQTGSLVQLPSGILTDGLPAWCGAGINNRFDPDLLRIRKITVLVRVQASDPSMRGTDPRFFRKPGLGSGPGGWIPDYEMRFEVTPRNLNLVR